MIRWKYLNEEKKISKATTAKSVAEENPMRNSPVPDIQLISVGTTQNCPKRNGMICRQS
jgi:hypothetical protein